MEEHQLDGALDLLERCLRVPARELMYPDTTLSFGTRCEN